jgi:hypothetical protein
MIRVVPTLLALSLTLPACTRNAQEQGPDDTAAPAPSGAGSITDGEQTRSVLHPIGFLAYGQTETGSLPGAEALDGYEFEASAGDQPAVTLRADGARVGLVLYGPRSRVGLWDDALVEADGSGSVRLSGFTAESAGMYFVLVRVFDGVDRPYEIRLECDGGPCTPPICADVEPCDLVCEDGFVFDRAGCRTCSCESVACVPGCDDDEVCERGECVPRDDPCDLCDADPEPVCGADGRRYLNPCRAACAGVDIADDERCDEGIACGPDTPCPPGQICDDDGYCEFPDCDDCREAPRQPVCTTDDRTLRNLCQAECTDEEIAYRGECVLRRCGADADCGAGFSCTPAPEIPGNLEVCREDPESDGCVRACRPAPPTEPCEAGAPCADGGVCVDGVACVPACNPDAPMCRGDAVCAEVGEDAGACLRPCRVEGDPRSCDPGSICLSDDDGVLACRPCDCAGEPLGEVCAEDRTYPNRCFAQCAGADADDVEPGRCEPTAEMCDACPLEPRPTCGASGTLYASRCELTCEADEQADVEACLPDADTALACRTDEDCAATCGGGLCASAPPAACPALSETTLCVARTGDCRCNNGQCGFRPTRATAQECDVRVGPPGGGDSPPDGDRPGGDMPDRP